jgi:hypothetical protein
VSTASPFNFVTFLVPSVRKFICADYSKASFSCSLSSCCSFSFCFIRYFVRKMCVALPRTILSTDPPKHLRPLPGVNTKSLFDHSASCCSNFYAILLILFHLLNIALKRP